MESYDIKLIKYGIIFFYDPATLRYNSSVVEIIKPSGEIVFSHPPTNIKRANFNANSGILTLKTHTGQKMNIAFKGDWNFTFQEFEPVARFRAYLDEHNIKGFTMH